MAVSIDEALVEQAVLPLEQVLSLMQEKYDIVQAFFAGIDYQHRQKLPATEQLRLLQRAVNAVSGDLVAQRCHLHPA